MDDGVYHDEVEIEDFDYDEDTETYYYPCPCGDKFEISRVSIFLYFSLDSILINNKIITS